MGQRENSLKEIIDQQFELVYFGGFSYEGIEEMTTYERVAFHSSLIDRKKNEKESYESSLKSVQTGRQSRRSKR